MTSPSGALRRFLPTIGELAGFVCVQNRPDCGMERVRLYDEKGNRGRKGWHGAVYRRDDVDKYTAADREDGRLHDPVLREISSRIFALHVD